MAQDHVERRSYLRVEVRLENLQVTVGILGSKPTTGAVLNIGRGGMKVTLSREIPNVLVGYDCLVRFVDPGDRVSPKATVGKLLRMEADGQYAIEFAKPLEVLHVTNWEPGGES